MKCNFQVCIDQNGYVLLLDRIDPDRISDKGGLTIPANNSISNRVTKLYCFGLECFDRCVGDFISCFLSVKLKKVEINLSKKLTTRRPQTLSVLQRLMPAGIETK